MLCCNGLRQNRTAILLLLGDIIKTFREEQEQWPSQVLITPLIDSSYDDFIWDIQDVAPTQDPIQMPPTTNIWMENSAPGGDNTYKQQTHQSPTTTLPQEQETQEKIIPSKEVARQPCQNVGTYKDGPAKI